MKPTDGLPKSIDDATRIRVRTMADRRAVIEGCRYDQGAVDRVVRFLRTFCKHGKGEWAGRPLDPLPWQVADIIEPIFGWLRPDGHRRTRRAYIEVPKKNGKSSLSAGLALYLLAGDGEPGAEIYAVAYGRQQARIVFDAVARMVRTSSLSKYMKPYAFGNRIVYERENAFCMSLSRDANLQEGIQAHGVIFDELHVQKTRDLWDALADSGAARRQPILISLTTAGFDRSSICYEQHTYSRAILEGSNDDPTHHAVIYAAPEKSEWQDPEVWQAANPSYGVTFSADEIAASAEKALASAAAEMTFRRRRLNQWVAAEARWLDFDRWSECADESLSLDDFEGRPCYIGLDLASSQDLTALCILFVDDEDEEDGGQTLAAFWEYWIPEAAAMAREKSNRGRFLAWGAAADVPLTRTPGDVTDYERIRVEILSLAKRFRILEVAYDPWNATHLANQLADEGVELVEYRQTYRDLSEPVSRLVADVLAGTIRHAGDPVTGWCIGNAVTEVNAVGDSRLSRKRSSDKIDGAVSLAMARGRSLVSVPESTESIYETADLREI